MKGTVKGFSGVFMAIAPDKNYSTHVTGEGQGDVRPDHDQADHQKIDGDVGHGGQVYGLHGNNKKEYLKVTNTLILLGLINC